MTTDISNLKTVVSIVEDYERQKEALGVTIAQFKAIKKEIEILAQMPGGYAGSPFRGHCDVEVKDAERLLLSASWRAVYSRLNIDRIAPASDKQAFERVIENPPELTVDNAKATFADYLINTRYYLLKGVAEIFSKLDPAYRSHSKVKIGVKGLPKRVIISGFTGYNRFGIDRVLDLVNALSGYRGQPLATSDERSIVHHAAATTSGVFDLPRVGLSLKTYANGNCHVIFDKVALHDINAALAEFYGELLPDVDIDNPTKQPSTAIAKDLQYYPTPEPVINRLIDLANLPNLMDRCGGRRGNAKRVLEPSCGDGRIMDVVKSRGHDVLGYEYNAWRCAAAKAKGHSVICANFLEIAPREEFDLVIMNPPFYGKHYAKHVEHAMKFLKPGGRLVAVLPSTARYDHGLVDGTWIDLPVASFHESGTNVPTSILTQSKRANPQYAVA